MIELPKCSHAIVELTADGHGLVFADLEGYSGLEVLKLSSRRVNPTIVRLPNGGDGATGGGGCGGSGGDGTISITSKSKHPRLRLRLRHVELSDVAMDDVPATLQQLRQCDVVHLHRVHVLDPSPLQDARELRLTHAGSLTDVSRLGRVGCSVGMRARSRLGCSAGVHALPTCGRTI